MARRGTFAFDLSQPLKRGTLLKQGAFHKAFKYRYFVLYPGFLVYYDDSQKWKLDVTKGNTLGGRLGAIKLKNGTCNLARDAPKGCKFGFIIHAPDPGNKRPTYLINSTSKDERDEWISAVKKATPHKSPQAPRKEIVNVAKKGSDKAKEEKVPLHPTRVERQETANAAALIASEGPVVNGEDKVEESITSIDEQLELPPQTIDIRRDTATVAALAISDEKKSSLDDTPQEKQEQATSIDDLLGPQNNPKEDSDGETAAPLQNGTTSSEPDTIPNGISDSSTEIIPSTPSPENSSPDPSKNVETPTEGVAGGTSEQEAESRPMDCNKTVENTVNCKGKLEVVTSVTIACASNGESDSECSEKAERGDSVSSIDKDIATTKKEETSEETTVTEKKDDLQQLEVEEEMKSSSEVILTTNDATNSFSVNVAMQIDDSDSTTSDEESPVTPTSLSDTPSTPQGLTNGRVSSASPTTSFPAITIDAPEGEEANKERTGSGSSAGSNGRLSPPQNRRKSSTPFIEKTGFLYKMGGKHKNWRRRFFILKPGGFHYYKKGPGSKPLGEVKLKNMSIFFPGVGERKQSYQFTVHTESSWNKRSDWVLAALSEREMKEWIAAFKLAGQKPGTPLSCTPPSDSDTEQ